MTDPLSGAALSIGGRVAGAMGKELTVELRLAKSVVAAARRQGVTVSQKQLRGERYDRWCPRK